MLYFDLLWYILAASIKTIKYKRDLESKITLYKAVALSFS